MLRKKANSLIKLNESIIARSRKHNEDPLSTKHIYDAQCQLSPTSLSSHCELSDEYDVCDMLASASERG